jgi:inward rectifier potassium channel
LHRPAGWNLSDRRARRKRAGGVIEAESGLDVRGDDEQKLAAGAPPSNYPRLGQGRAISIGLKREVWRDAYHTLLTISFPRFLALMAAGFLSIHTVFTLLYMVDPHGITNVRPGNFADNFFFSVQTLSGIGYGSMAPKSFYVQVVVTLEAFVGLFNLAIATGLMFARFSKPTARIMFSNIAVVAPFEGTPSLMFRAANQRRNLVVEAEVSVSMARNVVTTEGKVMRRFQDLSVVRARTPLFFLTWQVIHPIDEASPLFGETALSLLEAQAEILVGMKGTDETFVATIHARTSYTPDQIRFGQQLADIFGTDAQGRRTIDFTRFHDAS